MEINRFLTHLAVDKNVAASTQNQAFSALLFLFRQVLEREIKIDAVRAKLPQRLPVVLSVNEVRRVLAEVPIGPMRLMAGLMYGAGMRLMECCRLRVKDVDFQRRQITVRDGKGEKDRMVPFPDRLIDGLRGHIDFVRKQHESDVEVGAGWVWLPYSNDSGAAGAQRCEHNDDLQVVTEAFALLLVEQRALNQIMAGFNSKLDVHRSLPRFLLSLPSSAFPSPLPTTLPIQVSP